jgi:hypothetical protein
MCDIRQTYVFFLKSTYRQVTNNINTKCLALTTTAIATFLFKYLPDAATK